MSPTAIPAPIAVPGLRRNMVTICAMTATIMQALDTTIANVALPYMQGTLSASQDQINWVLTSYIVAAAIMTAPVGWIANRFGRKRTFIICSAGFTVASVLCGLAQDINQMVLFRLLQGVFGAALVPLSQAVMLDSYALHERAKAMSIWGMGVMMGPIMGPSLGAWLTETYSWHWVFFVNLPFGIFTVLGLMVFMDETKQDTKLRFDWFGFAALAIAIGALQVALDRGEQLGWLESNEIIAEFVISIAGFYYFFAHSFTTSRPFIQFALFKDRNFLTGCIFMTVMGLVLYSTMALASPYLQNVIGYPIITAGVLLASRGCGTFVAMMLVGRLMRYIEARTLIITGLSLTALSLYWMTAWTDQTGVPEIVTISIIQGFGFGLVFVPLSTVAFMTLPNHLRTDGTSMLTLMRNVASSVGISIVVAQLTEGGQRAYAILSEHITPFNHAMQMPDVSGMINLGTDKGLAMADVMVALQAQIIAFSQDYQLVMFFILGSIPLAIMIGSTKAALRKQAAGPEHAAVME
jgi:DHA2 family multidrug resistance protein